MTPITGRIGPRRAGGLDPQRGSNDEAQDCRLNHAASGLRGVLRGTRAGARGARKSRRWLCIVATRLLWVTPASELELACAELPSWRPYSTLPLTYHPPCGFGEMVPTRAARPTQAAHHTHAHSNGEAPISRVDVGAYVERIPFRIACNVYDDPPDELCGRLDYDRSL